MNQQRWIFLSPHFDDVALSCGGLVWDLARQGHWVEIWTLMAGFPPDETYSEFTRQNHRNWGLSGVAAVQVRRAEDLAACRMLNAYHRHFDWPDAIYRREPGTQKPLVNSNEQLFGRAPEDALISSVHAMLEKEIPQHATAVFPLGLGSHIDHLAVVRAGEAYGGDKCYYADYPYILKALGLPAQQKNTIAKKPHPLDETAGAHWQDAVLCYQSQLSAFWRDEEEARLALRNYQAGGGGRLWAASGADAR